jgi:hypothetical protein
MSFVIRGRCTAHSGTSGAVIFDARIGWPAEPAGRPAWFARPPPSVASVFIATSPGNTKRQLTVPAHRAIGMKAA